MVCESVRALICMRLLVVWLVGWVPGWVGGWVDWWSVVLAHVWVVRSVCGCVGGGAETNVGGWNGGVEKGIFEAREGG